MAETRVYWKIDTFWTPMEAWIIGKLSSNCSLLLLLTVQSQFSKQSEKNYVRLLVLRHWRKRFSDSTKNSKSYYLCFGRTVISSRISSVGRALDCWAGGSGFDSRGRTNTQGLKITEKWRYSLCPAGGWTFTWLGWPRKMAIPSPIGDVKIVSPISTFVLNILTVK